MNHNATPNALSWAAHAACQGADVDAFFTDSSYGIARAKAFCGACPVQDACLAEALRAEDGCRYGIYGGLTPKERADLVKSAARQRAAGLPAPSVPEPPRIGRPVAQCGTRSAYQRHLKLGEPVDAACRAANTAADRRLRTTGTTKVLR